MIIFKVHNQGLTFWIESEQIVVEYTLRDKDRIDDAYKYEMKVYVKYAGKRKLALKNEVYDSSNLSELTRTIKRIVRKEKRNNGYVDETIKELIKDNEVKCILSTNKQSDDYYAIKQIFKKENDSITSTFEFEIGVPLFKTQKISETNILSITFDQMSIDSLEMIGTFFETMLKKID